MPLRVPPDVKARLELWAELGKTSLNQLCVSVLERALRERKL